MADTPDFEDSNSLNLVREALERTGMPKDATREILTSLWGRDEMPEITDDGQYRNYVKCHKVLEDVFCKSDMSISEWAGTPQGVVCLTIGARILKWEKKTG